MKTRLHNDVSTSRWAASLAIVASLITSAPAFGQERMLTDISYSVLSASQIQVTLELSSQAPNPGSFTIDNPARIAIDLPETRLGLARKSLEINTGAARNIRAVEAGGRTRVVLSLTEAVPYQINASGNEVRVTIGAGGTKGQELLATGSDQRVVEAQKEIYGIDFRRGTGGEGQIVVTLDPAVVVDMQEQGERLVLNFINAKASERLVRRLNVVDFATPVQTIDTFGIDSGSRIVVNATPPFEHLSYQTGNTYTLEVKPVRVEPTARRGDANYTGEKLSLNFQNIEVRAVLQLIADFTGLNVVASDSVQGTITLRLKNVPWDQALDIILKTKGLGMRKAGNVVLIAPNDEIAAREKQELEAAKQVQELAPLRTEFFEISYAKASDISNLLKNKDASILSERGSVTIDERTNTLMVLDTDEKLDEIASLVQRLDIPVRQVLIESRIVIANDDFSRAVGVRAGATSVRDTDGGPVSANSGGVTTISGSATATDTIASSAANNLATTGVVGPVELPDLADRLNVNFPAAENAARLALAILGSDYLVDLELSALQQEGKGEVVSSPRVITANQKKALIEQGVEIPYLQATSSGATSVSFKKAVLSLEVTPQITPDNRVLLDLTVNKDSVGQIFSGIPSINTREVNTQVLVNNGDTVVLGGVYEQTTRNEVDKVPFLGDLPILGHLFKSTTKEDDKAELLIFVTPKILKEGLRATLQ